MFRFFYNRLRGPAINQTTLDLDLGRGELPAPAEQVRLTNEKAKADFKGRVKLLTPVLLSVALSMIGQLILKRGMSDLGPVALTGQNIFSIIWSIATNPFVIVGMFIYAASVLFWLVGLSRVPLSYAYPFISLSYVTILAASYFLLGEQLSPLRIGGVAVICLGVILVAYSDPGATKDFVKSEDQTLEGE